LTADDASMFLWISTASKSCDFKCFFEL